MRVLVLGGSTEASQLVEALAGDPRFEPVLSLAGRTEKPKTQPVTTRIGGFGGVAGLCNYLRAEGMGVIVDATHPFAAQMSRNAIEASAKTGVSLIALERPPWKATGEDRWICVADARSAGAAIGTEPRTVFCGLGRLALSELRAAPQHHYIIRLIDAPAEPLGLPQATVIEARGPFKTSDDIELFREHGVDIVLAKNSGGDATISKIEAARALGLPVIMIGRPFIPSRPCVASAGEALQWLYAHYRSVARGV